MDGGMQKAIARSNPCPVGRLAKDVSIDSPGGHQGTSRRSYTVAAWASHLHGLSSAWSYSRHRYTGRESVLNQPRTMIHVAIAKQDSLK